MTVRDDMMCNGSYRRRHFLVMRTPTDLNRRPNLSTNAFFEMSFAMSLRQRVCVYEPKCFCVFFANQLAPSVCVLGELFGLDAKCLASENTSLQVQ